MTERSLGNLFKEWYSNVERKVTKWGSGKQHPLYQPIKITLFFLKKKAALLSSYFLIPDSYYEMEEVFVDKNVYKKNLFQFSKMSSQLLRNPLEVDY